MDLFAGLKTHKKPAAASVAPAGKGKPTAPPPPSGAASAQLPPAPLAMPMVRDGGASWKARALKRA